MSSFIKFFENKSVNRQLKSFVALFIISQLAFFVANAQDKAKKNSSKDSQEWSIDKFVERINDTNSILTNKPLIKFQSFLADIEIPNSDDSFINPLGLEITYGFIRNLDNFKDYYNWDAKEINETTKASVKDIIYFGSEQISLGILSSGLAFYKDNPFDKKTDSWYFNLSYQNGYGYKLNNDVDLFLAHRTAYSFLRVDLEDFILNNNPTYKYFDEKMRLGLEWNPSLKLKLWKSFSFEAGYEYKSYFTEFDTKNFILITLFDNVSQRWIDFKEEEYLQEFGKYYPLLYFAYKNLLSGLVTWQRQNNGYFPFEGKEMLFYHGYKVSIGFEF
jgi:hypothetical protein